MDSYNKKLIIISVFVLGIVWYLIDSQTQNLFIIFILIVVSFALGNIWAVGNKEKEPKTLKLEKKVPVEFKQGEERFDNMFKKNKFNGGKMDEENQTQEVEEKVTAPEGESSEDAKETEETGDETSEETTEESSEEDSNK